MAKRARKLSEIFFEVGEPGEVLAVEIAYEEGGANWFHGGTSPRGYFLRVIPTQIHKDGIKSIILGEGSKALIEPAQRFSDKRLGLLVADPDLLAKLVAKVTADRSARNRRNAERRAAAGG